MKFDIYKNCLVEYLGSEKEVVIPFGIIKIAFSAFDTPYNYYIEKIVIPPSVTKIGAWAFCNCCGLTEIVIPNSVISIGKNAFSYCENLKKVTLPLKFKGNLDDSVFDGCFNLIEINFI